VGGGVSTACHRGATKPHSIAMSRSHLPTKFGPWFAAIACGVSAVVVAPVALGQYGLKAIERAQETALSAADDAGCDRMDERERRRCERDAKIRVAAAARRDEEARHVSRRYHRELARALVEENTPRSLVLAALLWTDAVGEGDAAAWPRGDAADVEANRWRAEARMRANDDPVALLLTMGREANPRKTGDDATVARWRAVDPKNLTPWMYDLADEATALTSDSAAEPPLRDGFFDVARATERFDLYFDDVVRETTLAVRRHPPSASMRKTLFAPDYPNLDAYAYGLGTALWASAAVPSFMPLVQACKGEPLRATPTRAADCRAMAGLLRERSDTMFGRLFGIALVRRAATDDAERLAIKDERRREDWRMAQWREAMLLDPDGTSMHTTARLLESADISEMALMDAAIARAGLSSEPPPDWDSGYQFPDEREAAESSP